MSWKNFTTFLSQWIEGCALKTSYGDLLQIDEK